jgi:hypothetical protein
MRLLTENVVPIKRWVLVAILTMVSAVCAVINVIVAVRSADFWPAKITVFPFGTRRSAARTGSRVINLQIFQLICHASSVSAGASWPSSSLPPVYKPRRHRRSCLKSSAFSLRQPLIGKALAAGSANHEVIVHRLIPFVRLGSANYDLFISALWARHQISFVIAFSYASHIANLSLQLDNSLVPMTDSFLQLPNPFFMNSRFNIRAFTAILIHLPPFRSGWERGFKPGNKKTRPALFGFKLNVEMTRAVFYDVKAIG